jgi:hypothetical protein
MQPNKELVKYFEENRKKFDLAKLREQAIKQGRSPEEVDLAIKSLKPLEVAVVVAGGSSFNFVWVILAVVIVGSLGAGAFFFLSNGEKSLASDFSSEIISVEIAQSELNQVLESTRFPDSLYLKYEVILPKDAKPGPIDINIVEFYYKKYSGNILKAKFVQKDHNGNVFSESVGEYILTEDDLLKETIALTVCTMGICLDAESFLGDLFNQVDPIDISFDDAVFIGKKNILGIDSFCFDVEQDFPEVGKKKQLTCKHPDYNIIMYNKDYSDKSEIILNDFQINPPLKDSIFELSSNLDLGVYSNLDIEGLMGAFLK